VMALIGDKVGAPAREFIIDLSTSAMLVRVAKGGETLQIESPAILEDFLPKALASDLMELIQARIQPAILTPLHRRGEIIGVLAISAPELAGHFIPSVRNLARHITTALELADEYAERARAERALQDSEEYFRSLIENAPDIIGVLNADATIRWVGPSSEPVSGYTPDELMGMNAFDLVHPDDVPDAMETFSRGVKTSGDTVSREIRFRHKDGSWRFAEFTASHLIDNPSVGGIVLNCRDITERKQTEEAFRQSEHRFRAIVENAPDLFAIVERDGTISFVNFVFPGHRFEDILGTSVYDYVLPELADTYRQLQERVFETGRSERLEVVSNFGPILDCRIAPLEKEGPVNRLMVIMTDVTDRRRAEEALRQSETRYRQLFDYAPDSVIILNKDGVIVECSHSAMLLYGYSKEEMIGKSISQFMHASSGTSLSESLSHPTSLEPTEGEIRIVRSDGAPVHLWRKAVPLTDADGNLTGMLAYDRDITDRKRAEELLRKHRDHLEKLVKERTSSLEDANTALRVMLKTADQMKAEMEESVLFNVRRFALPYIEELKKCELNAKQRSYLEMLERSLDEVTKPFLQGVPVQALTLTPTEVTVANLIKQGKTTKEIAEMLKMSTRTVETHRYNIRSKLGVNNRTVNLRTYISSVGGLVDRLSS
ncbi:MAG: PAS domain S-box protein, partial [Chloroflexi bacterium]|nr:PAS domain S-box protein [Chloroflexota bacterium]